MNQTPEGANHRSRIVYQLSQLIVRGELVAGEKLAEIGLAERFGVSRTPIRQALAVLEQEGLLVRDASRSYIVRHFSLQEILDAIEVRAALEGLAARSLAERRLPWGLLRQIESVLAEGDETIVEIETNGLTPQLTARYYAANARFHHGIIEGAQNSAITAALDVANKIPFVSVGSMARYDDAVDDDPATVREKLRLLLYSHMQHQDIFEALKAGQPGRAEQLMREHAHLGIRNLHLRDSRSGGFDNSPGFRAAE